MLIFPVDKLKFLPLMDEDDTSPENGHSVFQYAKQYVGCPKCGRVETRDKAKMGYSDGKYPRRICKFDGTQLQLLDVTEGQKMFLRDLEKSLS